MVTIRELDYLADVAATSPEAQQLWLERKEERQRWLRWFKLWWQVPYDPT